MKRLKKLILSEGKKQNLPEPDNVGFAASEPNYDVLHVHFEHPPDKSEEIKASLEKLRNTILETREFKKLGGTSIKIPLTQRAYENARSSINFYFMKRTLRARIGRVAKAVRNRLGRMRGE